MSIETFTFHETSRRDTDATRFKPARTPKEAELVGNAELGGRGLALSASPHTPFNLSTSVPTSCPARLLRTTHQRPSNSSALQPARARDSATAPASPMELDLCRRERRRGELGWWMEGI